MFCPMCDCSLVPTGSTMVEIVAAPDGTVSSVQDSYQCINPECASFRGDFAWTFNGETFIMHRLEAHQKAA